MTTATIDDLDGSEAAETVAFSLDGAEYEIDLSEKNAATLREIFAVPVANGRRTGGRYRRRMLADTTTGARGTGQAKPVRSPRTPGAAPGADTAASDGRAKVDPLAYSDDVRQWALANDYPVGKRGRLPSAVLAAYRAAHERKDKPTTRPSGKRPKAVGRHAPAPAFSG